jgi:hypothetical protein
MTFNNFVKHCESLLLSSELSSEIQFLEHSGYTPSISWPVVSLDKSSSLINLACRKVYLRQNAFYLHSHLQKNLFGATEGPMNRPTLNWASETSQKSKSKSRRRQSGGQFWWRVINGNDVRPLSRLKILVMFSSINPETWFEMCCLSRFFSFPYCGTLLCSGEYISLETVVTIQDVGFSTAFKNDLQNLLLSYENMTRPSLPLLKF